MPCGKGRSGACNCTITPGLNITMRGSGNVVDPFIFDTTPAYVEVTDGTEMLVSLEGSGEIRDPYVLSLNVLPSLVDGYWDRWAGDQATYDAILYPPLDTLHVVLTPDPNIPVVDMLYSGSDAADAIYAGDTLVAVNSGGSLVAP